MNKEKTQGDAMGGVDELYREVILDHFKAPKNRGKIETPSNHADGVNPLCGDQITISANIDNGIIKDIKFEGHGCAISQSSASMMTAAIKGKSLGEAKSVTQAFKQMFGLEANDPSLSVELGDLESLEGVKKYPTRIKCAVLAWNTFLESLENNK